MSGSDVGAAMGLISAINADSTAKKGRKPNSQHPKGKQDGEDHTSTAKKKHQLIDLENLKLTPAIKNFCSFDCFELSVTSSMEFEDVKPQDVEDPHEILFKMPPKMSFLDLWLKPRASMSTESFISSSTKVSEPYTAVKMESGWGEEDDEDFALLSDSDDDWEQESSVSEIVASVAPSSTSNLKPDVQRSSQESITARFKKEMVKIQASFQNMTVEDVRVAIENTSKNDRRRNFMVDIDEAGLLDKVTLEQLSNLSIVFNPDFEAMINNTLRKNKEKDKTVHENTPKEAGKAGEEGEGHKEEASDDEDDAGDDDDD